MEVPTPPQEKSILPPHREHPRIFHASRYVYPVLSRRSRGISIGINLNPDKVCNFDCVYCQVDREVAPVIREVDGARVLAELEQSLEMVRTGELFEDPRFVSVPEPLRRLNDIAFSGDGEPTTCPSFGVIVRDVADLKRRLGLDAVKMVLITNATMLHRPAVEAALAVLDANRGEIWAKLDAGTEAFYRRIERTSIPFKRVLDNLLLVALRRAIVIQSLFMTMDGEGPSSDELDAYCGRLATIREAGGQIAEVQVYTVARPPAERSAGPLDAAELERIGALVRERVAVPVSTFGG